jgi:uncharacterized protein
MQQLIVSVADILGRPGVGRDLELEAIFPGISNALVQVEESPVRASLKAESVVEGVLVTGEVEASASVACARCLAEHRQSVAFDLCELFVTPASQLPAEEAYRLTGTDMDLEPMLRDAVALALPLRPLCRVDCQGLCPTCGRDLNRGACDCQDEQPDPRWAALSGLRERLEG